MDVKKMTAGQLANMSLEQFNRLTAQEAKDALAIVRRSVNQRIRRLEAATDYSSPALEAMKKSGGKHLKPASSERNENLAELKRGIRFLHDKTATIKGSKQHFKESKEFLNLSDSANKDDVNEAYDTFHKAQQEFGGMLSKESGAERYNALKRKIGQWSEQEHSDEDIRAAIKTFYEREQARENEMAEDILKEIEHEFFIPNPDSGE